MISLADIKPEILNAKIVGDGVALTIPFLPLSYVKWNNAVLGLKAPEATKRRLVVNQGEPPVEALDYNDLEFQIKRIAYDNEVRLRRVAMALAGGGMPELQGIELEKQVEMIRDMDAGILNALYQILERLATKRTGAWFRQEPAQGDGDGTVPPDGLDAGDVDKPARS